MPPLINLIRKRYDEQAGWIVLDEVRNGTGHGKGEDRAADALALQTFPSRGISCHGFEVKVSRSDLIKELRDPGKAAAIQKWCEYWWLVVGDAELVEGVPIPETWGVLAPKRGVLRPVKEAPKLTPEPWTPRFCAAVVRAFSKGLVPASKYHELEQRQHDEVEALAAARCEKMLQDRTYDGDRAKKELTQLQERVEKYYRASGIQLAWEWNPEDLGNVVAAVRSASRGGQRLHGTLAEAKRAVSQLLGEIDLAERCLDPLRKLDEPKDPSESAFPELCAIDGCGHHDGAHSCQPPGKCLVKGCVCLAFHSAAGTRSIPLPPEITRGAS
jgi:hypothetical protein